MDTDQHEWPLMNQHELTVQSELSPLEWLISILASSNILSRKLVTAKPRRRGLPPVHVLSVFR